MFTVEDHGTIVLIRPLTEDVERWIAEHVDPEAQWFGGALACAPRYAEDIVHALAEEGYALQ